METKTYDSKSLTAYLLGALPEAESEIFDELSFTDDEFSDRLGAAEKELLDAYARGELTGETLEKFETFYLASPLRREKAEFAAAFQTFAEKRVGEPEANPAPLRETETKQISKGFWANPLIVPKLSIRSGLALAALALAVFGGWFWLENSRLRTEIGRTQTAQDELLRRESELREREKRLRDEIASREVQNTATEKELAKIREERARLELELKNRPSPAPAERAEKQPPAAQSPARRLNIASFILTPARRGSGQLESLSIPPRTDLAALRLELEPNDFSSYRVDLTDPAGRSLWRSGKLKARGAGENRSLSLQLPAKLLKSQLYTLTVSGIPAGGAAEIIGSYSFRVVLQ
jgi:hypothetical protein